MAASSSSSDQWRIQGLFPEGSFRKFSLIFTKFSTKFFSFFQTERVPRNPGILSRSVTTSDFTSSSSSQLCSHEVFLSFRGEDTRKTFVDHLYSALKQHVISVYKDDEMLPKGDSISPSLLKAIEESRIAVIIFSKNYANSSWCLDELAYIMKCRSDRGLVVMPIFYDVEPSEVRKQTGDFGKAFAKQEAEKIDKAKLWKKALVDVSNISGWEPKNIANGHESKVIKQIVDAIFDRLFHLNSDVDEALVGMTTRLNDLKSLLGIGSCGVRMVGISGVGGSGKTTLAFSLYKKISCHFRSHCIVDNIQVESNKHGLKTLQEKILRGVLKPQQSVQSVEEGKDMIKSWFCKRKVLILLDDVNDLDQLQALAGSHKWFGSGSLIIITTRDEHLLTSHRVDNVYRVKLLIKDEAIKLFKMHAYNEKDPIEDYEKLSEDVVSYASGLPLALKVLGSFLYDKNKSQWISALDKLKDIPDPKVTNVLKISYDGLESYQKELFLDIACFWRWEIVDDAMEILKARDFYPEIGIQVLRDKSLISVANGRFDMHDLVQEMGHYIVRGEHPKNPEKHSRVWKDEEIKSMCFGDLTTDYHNIESIKFENYYDAKDKNLLLPFCKIVSKMTKLRCLMVKIKNRSDLMIYRYRPQAHIIKKVEKYDEVPNFLSNELQYINWDMRTESPFPESFQPVKLVVLKLSSKQEELWKGCKHLPHLKVLELFAMKKLLNTPDFDGLPRLQKLILHCCSELVEIHPSLGNHTSLIYLSILGCPNLKGFPRMVQMKNLKTLKIKSCRLRDGDIPCDIGELSNLEELDLRSNYFSRLDFNLSQLTELKVLNISYCNKLLELPELPSNLVVLKADSCTSLTTVGECHKKRKRLCEVSLHGCNTIPDGKRLLQSMFEENVIENGSMLLRVGGVEVAKGFTPCLLKGNRCRVQLPENWSKDFCGFLLCAVLPKNFSCTVLSMKHLMNGIDSQDDVCEASDEDNDSLSGIDSQDEVWEQSDKGNDSLTVEEHTFVWYVSFGSLRNTTWWDQRYKALLFKINDKNNRNAKCSGFRVRLVDQKSRTSLAETSTHCSHHAPKFKIECDKKSALSISTEC